MYANYLEITSIIQAWGLITKESYLKKISKDDNLLLKLC